jgi:probable blue pigment (indigoidine) exporter
VTGPGAAVGTAPRDDTALGLTGAAVAVTVWGSSGVIAKHVDLGGLALGGYRFSIYAALMFAVLRGRRTPLTAQAIRHSFWGGISLGADVALFLTAVKLTSIVNATTIGALQPVVVGVVAARFFGERIRGRDVVAAAVALAGVLLVVVESSGSEAWSLRGDLAATGALFAWSGYFIFSRQTQGRVSPAEYTAATALYAGAINAVLAVVVGQDMSWPDNENLLWILVLAVGAGALGHSLMNWSLVRIPLWVGSTFTLLVPVVSAGLAWLVLGEALNALQIVGMVIVVGALAVIVRSQNVGDRHRSAAAPRS